MAAFFSKKPEFRLEDLPEELKELLEQLKQERAGIDALLTKARGTANAVGEMERPVKQTQERVEQVIAGFGAFERRAEEIEASLKRYEKAGERFDELESVQRTLQDRLQETTRGVADLQAVLARLDGSLEQAAQLKSDLDQVTGPSGVVVEIRAKADQLREQFLHYNHDVQSIREQQDALKSTQSEALGRYGEAREQVLRLKDEVGEATARVAQIEAALAGVSKVQENATRTEQDLQALNALADHVLQKTKAVEKQREVADRAAAQAHRLDDLVWDLDSRMKKLQQDGRLIKKTQDSLADLEELHRKVDLRSTEIRDLQRRAMTEGETFVTRLSGLKDEMKHSVERLDMDKQGFDALSQRVGDLRDAVGDVERRFGDLNRSGQAVSQAQGRVDELTARLGTVAADVARIGEQSDRVRLVQDSLERAESAASRIAERVKVLDDAQPAIQQLSRDVSQLKGTEDDVREATAQLGATRSEIERALAGQTDVRAWLGSAESAVEDLKQRIARVQAMAVGVEQTRLAAEQAQAAVREIEERRQYVDELERRLGSLGSMSTELDQRMQAIESRRAALADLESRADGLKQRLGDADRRFEAVARKADDLNRVEERVAALAARLEGAETKVEGLGQGVAGAEKRSEELRELSQWMERTGKELEQRQRAIAQASEHLERASQARQGASETAHALEEQGRRLSASLASAETQAKKIAEFAEQIEARAGAVRFAEKRITQFEEKLVELERLERSVDGAMQSLEGRRKSVEAVREEMAKVFATAEGTLADVRDIAAARPEVLATRAALDEVLSRAKQVDELAASIDRRKDAITLAEQRMARLDALLLDVRASLETLRAEKALIDHVTEKAGQLTFQAKAAEALISQLRDERDLTGKIYEALREVREEDKRVG